MVRPRRAEQCLPQEGATPQRDAGASEHGRGIPYAARSPLRGPPRATLRGIIPFQGVATQPCAAKTVQSALERTHPKSGGKVMQKVVVDHLLKIKK